MIRRTFEDWEAFKRFVDDLYRVGARVIAIGSDGRVHWVDYSV